ncbi:SNF2 family DNA-dependent ATPase [Stachybotrys elegans]|uniref:SNF2 family DNA-dependent ATPase n=1 Tax=Stachybotrys elegans TaxID=80388 RepID=A0A8K0WX70_9HYPO|nr:SNF2 family DNA-dependent ATPase [Stachybotrys elegans]
MATDGRSPRPMNTLTSWNPAALLHPSRQSVNTADARSSTIEQTHPLRTAPRDASDGNSHGALVFQFASADTAPSTANSSQMSSPNVVDTHMENGVGNWIERVNNVQHRSAVPQPKRRKVDEHDSLQIRRNGSGVLGEYVKEKGNEPASAKGSPAVTVDLTDGNDDDIVVVGDPRDEEVCYGMVKVNLNATRVPTPKPGVQSLLGSRYHPGIKLVLKRQDGDRSLKIQVSDHTREMIGLIDPSSAAAIAPLLDSKIQLRTDCRIPPRPRMPDELPGRAISKIYGLDLVMYGPMRYTRNVGMHLHRHGLKLLAPYMVQKGIKVHNPHVSEYKPPAPKAYPTDGNATATPLTTRTVEEVRSEVMGVFDSLTRNEDLPFMDPTSSITTPLLNHQKQGLYFMMNREQPRHLHTDKTMVSFWQNRVVNGTTLFYNVITSQSQKHEPPETRGGILADMMGLGKTLSILSLVASTTNEALEWEKTEPAQPTAPEARPARHDPSAAFGNLGLTYLKQNSRTTLLICPLSTITNWEEQIKQHVSPGSLNYHIYHGSSRIKDVARLAAFDLVITTYGSVSNELSSRRKRKDGLYPLEEIGWFRIVLDEAHMIREQNTLQFKAICRLQAQRRWAVTGTPVQNRLDDLAALLAFLRLHPFEDRNKFTRYIVEPFKACDPEIVPKLRVLVDSITLRRLKDKIDLPPREDLVVRLDFSPEERGIYELFARNAQDRVKILAGVNNERALGGNTYIHILKAILRLRLLCAHGKDLLNEDDLATLQGMSAEMAIDVDDDDSDRPALSDQKAHEMFTLMQETNNDACIECSKKLMSSDPQNIDETQEEVLGYMTPCFHVVCRSCIKNFRERAQEMVDPRYSAGPCPVCDTVVRLEYVELRRRDVDAEHDGPAKSKSKAQGKKLDRYDGPHTKTRALVEDLLRSKAASEANPSEPPFKSVVFSGWTSHLDLIELALKAAGISFTRLDGSMSRTARTAAMDSFRDDPSVHVILVSIMAGGLGLNLTAGNNVYVMEPQYNPAAEAQAIDRVHRLGQKRPVRTVRYIMRDSFEEKMLELQEKKMKLASLSMDGRSKALDKAEAARQKLMDLRSLFK